MTQAMSCALVILVTWTNLLACPVAAQAASGEPPASTIAPMPTEPGFPSGSSLAEPTAARPSPGSASTAATEAAADRLDGWLDLYADRAQGPRMFSGYYGVVAGPLVAISSAIALGFVASDRNSPLVVSSILLIGIGIIDTVFAIYDLLSPSAAERRLTRWRELRARGPARIEDTARFQGEIRGELASVEVARWLSVAWGAALFCAGGVGAGLTAWLAQSEGPQLAGYAASGAVALIGVALALIPWVGTQLQDEWREIEAGHPAPPHGPRVSSVLPWASPFGAGLTMNGSF